MSNLTAGEPRASAAEMAPGSGLVLVVDDNSINRYMLSQHVTQLGHRVALAANGREALEKQKQAGVKRRLVAFVLQDPGPVLWGSEPILRDGQPVGYTTSGAYGHSVGGAVAMGYVNHSDIIDSDFVKAGHYEINVSAQKYPAKAYLRAPFDPQRTRILA